MLQNKEANAQGNQNSVINADESARKPRGKVASAMVTILAPFNMGFRLVRKYTNLTIWIIISMIIGILVGKFAPSFGVQIEPLGTLFIRMIQCVVGPLIFSTLVVGIAGHGDDLMRVGRLALKSIVYFEVVTTFALIIGLLAVNIAKPGLGFSGEGLKAPEASNKTITWADELFLIVPDSYFGAMSNPKAVLAVVFCAVMFSIAIMRADPQSKKVMLDFNAALSAIMFKVVELVMNYAPIGVGCAIAATVGKYGLSSLIAAGKLVGTLYATLIIFAVLIFLPIILMCRLPLRDFGRAVAQPFIMAFATASSESALPKAMENMVAFGCPPEIVAFVIPTGYSFNLDGSTLYLALAAIFCAQVAGISKSIGEQIVIMLTLMLSSKGVAAVPRASFIVLTSTLSNAEIPLYPLALIMGVDAFMDMARTSINVLGNMTACAVISRWEGEFRNDAWQAQQAGQPVDTLSMDVMEAQEYGHSSAHESRPLGGLHAEKASIRSVHSTAGGAGRSGSHSGDNIV
ncbi:MAG: dicarboxylate/amino acid:cation symporter family protein [Benniella sp.]|nr:MAG: dicarboxylate/amino acid:cation symporter family protein [Benniella sp.]